MPTPTEEFLSRICRHSFLSLWSHPHPHRNTTPVPHELCDVLVVFGNDVILFSDKSIKFPLHDNVRVAWGRWYRAAILDSARKLFGATRWVRDFPGRVFADAACTEPIRVPLPDPANATYHIVAVAWGAGDACHQFYGPGSSRSLMIKSDLVGDAHFQDPFSIGRVDPIRPFVHVFDEMSLQCVMREIDTTPDFIEYLKRRASLLATPNPMIMAPGEEELLASYLTHLDAYGEHSFLQAGEGDGFDGVMFGEGGWNNYLGHQQRKAKIDANKISYLWDHLVEHFIKELPERSSPHSESGPARITRETALRVMASETRLSRRMYGRHLADVLESTRTLVPNKPFVRVGFIPEKPDTAYVFLVLTPDPKRPREEYELARNNILAAYCNVLSVELPEAGQIVGIAMVPAGVIPASEALFFMRTDNITDEFRHEARRIQAELNILVNLRERVLVAHETEYPDGATT